MSTSGPPGAGREPGDRLVGPAALVPSPRVEVDTAASVPDAPAGTPPFPDGAAPDGPPAHRWGLGAYLLAETVFLGTSVLLVLPSLGRATPGHPPVPPVPVLLLGLTVPTLLAATVALLATRLRGNGPARDLGLRFEREDLTQGLAFGCGGLVLTIPAAALWAHLVGPDEANSAVAQMFAGQHLAVPLAVAVFLVVWLVAPVCEEIVYRGLLWGAVDRHVPNRWWTFAITTLCFALAHFEFDRTPLLLIIALPIGLARLRTGRLGASIIAHQLNNLMPAVALLMMLLGAPPVGP